MDIGKLIDLAGKLDVPGLADRGIQIALDVANYAALVKANAARGAHVLSDGDAAELDAIHDEAMAANTRLDAALAAAEKR